MSRQKTAKTSKKEKDESSRPPKTINATGEEE
jgi:hypothetical protein